MIDPTKTTPEKLAEMNDSLIVDNNHLRARVKTLERQLAELQLEDTEIHRLKDETIVKQGDLLAERDAEIAKYRDAPVVWIHSDHLHQARNQPYLCRMSPVQREGYKPLIVNPGEQ